MKKDNKKTIYDDVFNVGLRKEGINSKKKGDRNEMIVAKLLSVWTGYEFKRVPASGGIGSSHTLFVGDVVCVSPENNDFPFTVETKHYKHIPTKGELRGNSQIFKFWQQALRDANKIDMIPLLMFRENGMKKGSYIMYFDKKVSFIILNIFRLSAISIGEFKGENIYGFVSEDILSGVKYNELVKLIK